ncbi:MAG: CDP-glucose 4,6-dehydratase [Candidatus Paracaedibacteraceae bacterium]|nr:CDP-glucose 4,6-dehydratase [Candidatus Paracaedibacteraceae bacterium]
MNNSLKDFYNGKKVFITGHTGFKGSWLAYWLSEMGATVTGYALEPDPKGSLFEALNLREDIYHTIGDIRNKETLQASLQAAQPDMVFHLAAQALVRHSYDDPINTFSTNVMGSLNVLEAIRNQPAVRSLVYITSDKCYWNNEWVWGYRETDALGGPDPYSASKACAEHVFKSYYLSYFKQRENFGCGSTRAGNVIGGGDRSKDRIVPDIITAAEKNTPVVLRNPNSTRPWQHVLDPLHGYMVLGKSLYENPDHHNGEGWNFGPSNQSIKTVYELTKKLTRLWDNIIIEAPMMRHQPHESGLLHLSIDKAQTLLGWEPKLHFDEAVKKTGEWYKRIQNGENAKKVTQQQIKEFMNA